MSAQRQNRFRNIVYGVALTLMIGWILYIGKNVFVPVISSVILAYIVTALAERIRLIPELGPLVPASIRFTISILVIAAIIGAFVYLIIANLNQLIALTPQYQARLLAFIQGLFTSFGEEFGVETEVTWETIRRDIFGGISLQSLVGSTVTSVSVIVGSMFVVFVYTGFALSERRLFERKLERLTDDPDDARRLSEIVSIINTRIGDYLVTKTLVNLILGLMSYALIAFMGLDFAAFFGVFIAIANYVPYIGSVIGVAVPVAIAVVQFGDITMILIALIGLSACQIIVGSLIEPNLMGRSLNLSPFVVLVALTSWGSLWGIAGALLSVPITAILVIILSEFDGTRPVAILLSQGGKIPPKRHTAKPGTKPVASMRPPSSDPDLILHD